MGGKFWIAALAVTVCDWACGSAPQTAEPEPQALRPPAEIQGANAPTRIDRIVEVEPPDGANIEEARTPLVSLDEDTKERRPPPPAHAPALVARCVGGASKACDKLAKLTLDLDRQLVEAACRGLCREELTDCDCARRMELGALVILDGDERIELNETLASGVRLTAEGDYDLAIEAFGKVLHYNPIDARALAGIGRVHQIRGALARAEMYTRVALDLTRGDRAAEVALSTTLQEIIEARKKP